jgi:uncharacterized protein YbaR (Trm112 family)
MRSHALEGKYGQPLALDLCFACSVLWFDGFESLLLAPGAILALFTLIHEHRSEQQQRALMRPACPRCRVPLVDTHDRQRHVQFHYWRCPAEHGRLTTFVEFLREKDFVRPLAPAELADLKARVRSVRCDGCGAAIDLEVGSTCPYCRSPVSMLDPKHVDQVVRELQSAEDKRHTVDPTLPVRLAMDRLAVDRFFNGIERESGRSLEGAVGLGLVGVGIAAVVGMLAGSSD